MFKKIFVCTLTLLALVIGGCGEEKILGTPDKAILAYAEVAMTGKSDNLEAAGLNEDDRKEICYMMANRFVDVMSGIAPLSNESAEQLAQIFFDKMQGKMKFDVTLKEDDANQPLVEIRTTPIDYSTSARTAAGENDDFIALLGMVGKLKSDGATDEQLKENPEVQKLAVSAVSKYIDEISFGPEETFSVPCKKIDGHSGNKHWAPANIPEFIKFLTGQ